MSSPDGGSGGASEQVERVIFAGDVFRARENRTFHQDTNVLWLRNSFEHFVRPLGFDVSSLESNFNGVGYNHFFDRLYPVASSQRLEDQWAAIYEGSPPDWTVEFLERCVGALVIGFELPPIMRDWFDHHGVVYIDIRVHPIRFLPDLILAMRSNEPEIDGRLQAWRTDFAMLGPRLSFVKGFWGGRSQLMLPERSLIFLGQTRHDATVIENGRFFDWSMVPQAVVERFRQGPAFILNHPRDAANPIAMSLAAHTGAEVFQGINFYELLTRAPRNARFVTISSSAGREAQAFGYEVEFLGRRHYAAGSPDDRSFTPLDGSFLHQPFWSHVLRGDGGPRPLPPTPEYVRKCMEPWALTF